MQVLPHRCITSYNQTVNVQSCWQKDLSGFERRFIVGARTAGAPVTEAAPLAGESMGTAAEVTSALRSMGKTSVNGVGNRGRRATSDSRDARAKNFPQVTENVDAGRDQTVSATVHQWLHKVRLRCVNASLQRWMHIWELSGAKATQAPIYILHYIIDNCVIACVAYTKRDRPGLNAWPLQRRDPVALLCCILLPWFGSTCSLRGKGHCKSMQNCSTQHFYHDWSALFIIVIIIVSRMLGLFLDLSPPEHLGCPSDKQVSANNISLLRYGRAPPNC